MTNTERHLEDEAQFNIPRELAEDLKGLYGVKSSVPGDIDRAILDRAGRRLTRRSRRFSWPRWAAVAGAAAAVIFVAVILQTDLSPVSDSQKEPSAVLSEADSPRIPADIDLNGKVDILDAFKLARNIESGASLKPEYDFNADGAIDRKDVDSIAFAAVLLDKGA
ncbi:MAG: dockerin type I domain-containing protein [Planctomycetota bacterium]